MVIAENTRNQLAIVMRRNASYLPNKLDFPHELILGRAILADEFAADVDVLLGVTPDGNIPRRLWQPDNELTTISSSVRTREAVAFGAPFQVYASRISRRGAEQAGK